jgi:hypothetical protein
VKARYPKLQLSQYVCDNLHNDVIIMTYALVEEIISQQQCDRPEDEHGFDIRAYYDNSDEIEEEEDEDSEDSDDGQHANVDIEAEMHPPDEGKVNAVGDSYQSSSVEVLVDKDSIHTARGRRQTTTTLPRTWDEYYYASILTNRYLDHPDFDEVSPREFYNIVRGWPWNPRTGHTAPPGQREVEYAIRKNLQLKNSDEFTFDELPDPRLYGIDEGDLLSRVKEYKLREDNQVGYRGPTDYWTWMQIFEQANVQLVRDKHMTTLQENPFMVLDASPIVGNLLFPGSMDLDVHHLTKRFETMQLFEDLCLLATCKITC